MEFVPPRLTFLSCSFWLWGLYSMCCLDYIRRSCTVALPVFCEQCHVCLPLFCGWCLICVTVVCGWCRVCVPVFCRWCLIGFHSFCGWCLVVLPVCGWWLGGMLWKVEAVALGCLTNLGLHCLGDVIVVPEPWRGCQGSLSRSKSQILYKTYNKNQESMILLKY